MRMCGQVEGRTRELRTMGCPKVIRRIPWWPVI
jgi:hypothetical protein